MLMLLCRTTRLVGTARSNDNINSNAKNYSDCRDRYCIGKTSARQGWDRFWHVRKGSFGAFYYFFSMYNCNKYQDYKEWFSAKLAILLGERKGPSGKL